ncbi:type 11 methyltransferase [Alcanivorax venustensis ISO4]|jgi:ubiquinone/menaquinone biosynthesis C-methylase UbiE|uniref:Type 11 methyltransferase n=1 Tax=Alloalcanivorax venustensis ISO4 TaxID=1177184 RepID=A0ABS0AIF9_9GAMM|nr:class I SAM-dependent methyltransferase [Alloalcanivorax venustensis]MBF5053923.1 type 11 methyltransferase [Alloalcanivorax venustensis ISO4]
MLQGSWDKVASDVDFNLEIDLARFLDLISRKAKVLDFGCGYGRISNELTESGYTDVMGVDPSCAMIERGRKAFPGLPLLHLDGMDLPFGENAFDAVVICAVLTCIPSLDERGRVAAEITRVLKPGGAVHISEFCSEESKSFISGLGLPMRYSSPEELRDLFASFSCFHDEVVSAATMSGDSTSSYRAFIRKPLNKAMHATSA